ncbi:MAG: aminotransferase class III-fold pyridoxal phosphate-dependent enzyme [Candidatus Sulfopaludibacter sp.]|nr:aminotransferase class III-fold pyridoxal phosphate-dependent enzyme [Candidatus Sulfopaludibacter sp.]
MTPLVQRAPGLSREDAARIARELYGVRADAEPLPSERDQNFRLGEYVLKIANGGEPFEILDMQTKALQLLAAAETDLTWPRTVGKIEQAGGHYVRLLTWVNGVCLADIHPHDPELLASLGRALAQTDNALQSFSHPAAHRTFYWDLAQAPLARRHLPLLPAGRRGLVEPHFDAWERVPWGSLPASIIYGDANDYNVLVTGGRVTALLDLGDMVHTATVCDLAIALAYAMLSKADPIAAAAHVVAAYHRVRPLNAAELDALFPLAAARLAMSVCYAVWQHSQAPQNTYLNISNAPAWQLLEKLAEMPAGWPSEVFHHVCEPEADLLGARRRTIGPSLSLSYDRPLHITRGWKQFLYDSTGRGYLDCVNNVAHVGHCHPAVTSAAAAQMALLNTNTRYLHRKLTDYAERLTATLPNPLRVVYLVCSGSEANELALRLARAHTGRQGVIVVDTAYHGNTNALVEISPYKFNGPGGRGRPPHVQVVPMPDVYRGVRYAGTVAEAAAAGNAGAFLCESALGCGGQIILPPGYLRDAFAAVRQAGGVCIADEVQTGFGRAGSHFWMFETQDAVPDIVTMGKPIGNGHPMGAVVTTREIAASFNNGMEYFNTFGGNPVSCAVGLAVLDVIREEGLQENARIAGEYLMAGLRDMAGHDPLIGDVRGQGLFIGVELVRDRETREPAASEASALVNRMKDRGILLSTDGTHHNVIKIKPPIVFSRSDADLLVREWSKG